MKVSVAVSALFHAVTVVAKSDCVPRDERSLQEQLTPLLSEDAVLSFPSSEAWDSLNQRASSPRVAPNYVAVVEVATEEDVQNTVSELQLRLIGQC